MRTMRLVRFFLLTCSVFAILPGILSAQCPSSWTIKDDCGPILANGGIAPNSPPIFCEGQIVTFLNTTDPAAGVTKVYMDWGDGTCESYDGNPPFFTHAYDVPDDSCISVPSSTYLLYMGVEKKCGAQSSFHYIITPLAVMFKPVADPVPPQVICQNAEAIFLNQCNTPSNTTATWTTSDGAQLNGETFTHIFTTPGTHNVNLTVANMCGSDGESFDITVTPSAVAQAVLSDTALCLPNAIVQVTNQSQNAMGQQWTVTPDANYVYLNGTGPGSTHPKIKFLQPGNYILRLQVIGCGSPSWTQVIKVNKAPLITLDTIANSCGNVTLDPNTYFTADGGENAINQWTFSGAFPASHNGANAPSVLYYGVGLHTLSLNLTNHCGTVTRTDSFYILPSAVAAAALSDSVLCIPEEVLTVTNNSQHATSLQWWVSPGNWGYFTGGTNAGSTQPVFQFTNEGLYTVHLKVTGCGNPSWSKVVRVRRKPDANLIQPIQDACFSAIVNPTNHIALSGGQPDYINWSFSGGLPASTTGPVPPQVVFPDTGYHIVQLIAGNVCGADTVSAGFTIFSPTVVTAVTPIDSICRSANSIQLQAIPNGGTWSGPGVTSAGVFDPAAGLNNAWNQLVYYYGPPDCRLYDTVSIFVMSIEVDAGAPLIRCVNAGSLTLNGQSPTGGIWVGPGVSLDGVFDPAQAGTGQMILSYTVVDANGCPNFDALQVTVLGAPTAVLALPEDACIGTSVDFGELITGSNGGSCSWNFGDGAISTSCYPYHSYFTAGQFDVQLIISAANGCSDTASQPIIIHDLPDASFANDQTEGCADLQVEITNTSTSTSSASYAWNYGDGATDTLTQPGMHVYTQGDNDTTYLLELTVTNQCGLAIYAEQIVVHPRPVSRFASNVDDGCTPLTVYFNNLSVGSPLTYRWYVNGVLRDTNAQLAPQTLFAGNTDSLYRIVLVTGNACGNDTLQRDIVVHPNTVVAFIQLDTSSGCAPLTIHAVNFSTDGMYASWRFGDGNSGVGDSVQHTYPEAGDFLLYLYVNNGCGYDTISVPIHVLPHPLLGFEAPPYVCYGDTLSFINTSSNLSGCHWYFGDGSMEQSMDSPGHMYASPGEYEVQMVGFAMSTGCVDTISQMVMIRDIPLAMAQVEDRDGCEPFSIAPSNLCSGGQYYLWDFGDGHTSTQYAPTHVYQQDGQFDLRLKIMDQYGCSDTCQLTVLVYPNPDISFETEQGPLCETPVILRFFNTSQHADAYDWSLGNGMVSTAVSPAFSIVSGPLDVQLSAQNMFGCQAALDTQIVIYNAPMVELLADEKTGCAPFTAVFENVSGAVNNFHWNFGDGQSSAEANPIHTFEQPGTYRVRVVADHDGLCFDSSEVNITVLPVPVAAFSSAALSDTTVVSNGIFLFNDASTNAVEWFWDFGDGNTATVQNPVHRYLVNGDKHVTLVVANTHGCLDTIRQLLEPDLFGNLFIPNTFSPEVGADGAREFRPVGIGLREFKIEIFATNGQRVWVSDKLVDGQPIDAWNGTFKGEICPPGIYWWKCSAILANSRPWEGMSFDGQEDPMRAGKLLLVR